ncbi:MAG: pitrilysin family protein, partial [Alphaproteobacteria bacterium]|nr:pitrilysin family protein [Alphaproteobacteria bacterium]
REGDRIVLIRLFALIALFMAVAYPPTSSDAGVFNPETFMLDNGMRVVVVPNHRAPVVVHMVWYKVGSADDPAGSSGIAHFLEHLMFKGTPSVPDGEFSKIVARNGGNQNAFTNRDYTGYFQKVAKDRLELVMGLEADRMVNLVLDDSVVLPERKVILEERRSRTDNDPGALWAEQLTAARYLAHPYRIPVIGWAHEIAALETEEILAFYRRYYAPDNAVLVVAGDVTAEEVRPMAMRTYGAVPATGIMARIRPQEPPHRAARRVELRDARVRQAEWSRTHLAPSYTAGASEHAYALQVLAELLGGGSTSRFYRALVIEGKVAVSAGAWYSATSLDLSQFGLYASPAPGIELAQVEAAVEAEIELLLAEGVSEAEVSRITARMTREAIYARESLGTAARIFGAALTSGRKVEDVEAWPDQIAAVTAEAVMAAARAVLVPETSVTGLLLPAEQD